ncbi:hypothetical protein FI667_g3485, partial [Globisporangium splendens]
MDAPSPSQQNADKLLASVRVVSRVRPEIAGLPRVLLLVCTFVHIATSWSESLERAAAANDVRWIQRLLAVDARVIANGRTRSPGSHPFILHYKRVRAARVAAREGHTEVLKCLHAVDPKAVGAMDVFVDHGTLALDPVAARPFSR